MVRIPDSLAPLIRILGADAVDQIVAIESAPARAAVTAPIPPEVHADLRRALADGGYSSLYRHQADAWDRVKAGEDIVVVTATASGKTLSFNLPIINAALADPGTRALYLYPTKALANDQAASLDRLTAALPITVAVYHGETEEAERSRIRANPPNILITNPDTLHHNHLARHSNWALWWRSLRFVVVDEAHAYRGVFGSHVAHVLRRLRRIATHYGANPLFISASATIGNPSEHVSALTGRPPVIVDHDGSPQVARDYVLWRPRRSSEIETARLVRAGVQAGQSVIGFARSRRAVERIRRTIRRDLIQLGRERLDERIAVYRAGFLATRRREIEAGLRDGTIQGVVSTNALELGIDIGSLGVAVLSSYPGSTMAFRQQAGRAGRRDTPALVMMVIGENPLDEYIADHPAWAISAGAERAAIDTANESVASGQLGCAARELPLTADDRALYGEDVWRRTGKLSRSGVLLRAGMQYDAGLLAPRPRDVNLRSLEGNPYRLLYKGRVIGDIDARYVAMEAHPGAIYLQDGEPYRVEALDRTRRNVHLQDAPVGTLTRPLGERFVNVRAIQAERDTSQTGLTVRLCELHVRSRVAAYQEIDEQTRKPIGDLVSIEPVTLDLNTHGLELQSVGPGQGLHAVEHLVRSLAPLVVLCDPADLDGHTDIYGDTTAAAYVFDRTPGGSGLSKKLFDAAERVLADAALRLMQCDCANGCPLCLHLGNCMSRNDDLSKEEAALLLGITLSDAQTRSAAATPLSGPSRPPRRACSKCGRTFGDATWTKGFPYGPHNRVKGDPSQGVCSGSERFTFRADDDQVPAGSQSPVVGEAGPAASSAADVGKRLEILKLWRRATAARLPGMSGENIVSSIDLQRIAEANPASLAELQTVGHFPDEWLSAFGRDVLRVLRLSDRY